MSKITRRAFLRKSTAAAALTIVPGTVLEAKQPSYISGEESRSVAGKRPNIELRFNADKKFKIVQFTDLHVVWNEPKSDIVFERIDQVIGEEKPDLLILTGDIIFSKPGIENMRKVLKAVSDHKIPFAITFGNHDHEQGATNAELLKVAESMPYNVTFDEAPEISGDGNCVLPILSSDGKKDACALYCIDSHAYSQIEGIKGYDYIKRDQIDWYSKRSAEFKKQNGGVPLPSLAFFHIALPEYNLASTNENAQVYGIRREKACSPVLNSGMFTAMKENGDIMGVFVGHDHDNDYAVCWHDVLLAFGRYTGGDTVYNHLQNGARIIELTEGTRAFKTWIRTKAGVEQVTTYPDSYVKK